MKLNNKKIFALVTMGIAASSCTNWVDSLEYPSWDKDVATTEDGVYINLPHAGMLIRVNDKGIFDVVDLNGAEPTHMVASPDGTQVLVFSEWVECEDNSEDIVYVDDCDYEDLVTHSELAIVQNASTSNTIEIPSHLNTVSFSDDGLTAVAYLDYNDNESIQIDGVADLGEVAFIRLSDGTRGSISVGFSPSKVLFGPNNQAVVMSRSQVVAVDLDTFEKTLDAPLSLDADMQVDPSGAELAYDEETGTTTLLLTVEGSSDLYMLDLNTEFWNIGDLGAIPSSLGVASLESKSVFVFDAASKAVILDHSELSTLSSGSIQDITLEEPANSTLIGDGFALLYNDNNSFVHDVYRLDLETGDIVEYVLANPVEEIFLSDSGRYAVGILSPEDTYGSSLDSYQDNYYGVAVLDMNSDDSVSLVAETRPLGLKIIEDDTSSYALVLMEGQDDLLYIDLNNPSVPAEIALPAPPVSIETFPDGRFLITHLVEPGMISFLDPESLELQTVSGFAMMGVFEDKELSRREEEK